MDDKDTSIADLEALLTSARTAPPATVPEALTQTILSDAAQIQKEFQMVAEVGAVGGAAPELWRGLMDALGGWFGVSGLAAASLVGVWMGVAPPEFLPDPVSLASSMSSEALLPLDSFDLADVLAEEVQ